MKQGKTKMSFGSIEQRDKQLRAFTYGSYTIDRKNPLVVWLNF